MIRRVLLLVLCPLLCLYLDTIFFHSVNLFGTRPDAMLALMVSFGLLMGSLKGGIFGLAMGLLMDVLCGKMIGLHGASLMIAGAAGGIFYQKYYADNVIVPALVACVVTLFKECIMGLALVASGGSFPFFETFLTYMLPCAAFTLVFTMGVHALARPVLTRQVRRAVS